MRFISRPACLIQQALSGSREAKIPTTHCGTTKKICCALLLLFFVCSDQLAQAQDNAIRWNGWFTIPGGLETDVAPAIAVDNSRNQVVLVARRKGDGHVFLNLSLDSTLQNWRGWLEIPGNASILYAPDVAFYSPGGVAQARLGVVAVFPDHTIRMQSYDYDVSRWNSDGWEAIPGGGVTDAGVSMTEDPGGTLYVAGKGINDKRVYVNIYFNGSWGGWNPVPGTFATNVGPRVYGGGDGGSNYAIVLAPRANDNQICITGELSIFGLSGFLPVPYAATTNATLGKPLDAFYAQYPYGFAKGIGDGGVYGLMSSGYEFINGTTDAGLDSDSLYLGSTPTPPGHGFTRHFRNILIAKGGSDDQVWMNFFDSSWYEGPPK